MSIFIPRLPPLPPDLLRICLGSTEHFGRNSVSYNNVLALGATGVDNGDDEGHGFEKMHGGKLQYQQFFANLNTCSLAHAVKLHGRTYHFLQPTSRRGGL